MKLFICLSVLISLNAYCENQHGLFMVVKGDVKLISGTKAPFPAKVGTKVLVGDMVTTGADSRAKIVMVDRNVINVSPDSKMQIAKYSTDATTGAKNVEIKLDEGKIRNNVEQSYDGEKSKYILKTPTAVAGVRGTQFVTSFNSRTQKTEVVTMKGQVSFASMLNGKIVGKPVVVNKGETTASSPGAPPEKPKALPKNELKEIDKDSTAATKTKNETVADNKSEGAKPGDGPKDGPKDAPKDGASGDPQKRDPASAPMAEGSMMRPEDVAGVPPPVLGPPPPPLPPPRDIPNNYKPPQQLPIDPRGQFGKTNLIIIPQ